jgi:hypothetical protein
MATQGATVHEVLASGGDNMEYFRPKNPNELYHIAYLNTEQKYDVNKLNLSRQKGSTCMGHSIYTSLRHVDSPVLSTLFPTPDPNDRHNFASFVFNKFGDYASTVIPELAKRGFPLIQVNRNAGFSTKSEHLTHLLGENTPVTVIVSGKNHDLWLQDGERKQHMVVVLGYSEPDNSFGECVTGQ